jgi:hypothetical protein
MVKISSLKASSKTLFIMSSSVSTRSHSFSSQFMMSMIIVILLIGFFPYVSSSPTPSSIDHDNKMNYESNGFMLGPSDYKKISTDDVSSLLSPTVQHSLSDSLPYWYSEPRARANQFLLSHNDDNEIIIPKWFARFYNDDDVDDYVPSTMLFDKRSTSNNGGYSNLKKRKQLTKPPMEVMNEIVNSIYLKR